MLLMHILVSKRTEGSMFYPNVWRYDVIWRHSMTSYDVTAWRHDVMWCQVTSQNDVIMSDDTTKLCWWCIYLCPKGLRVQCFILTCDVMTSFDVTAWCHDVMWRHVTSQNDVIMSGDTTESCWWSMYFCPSTMAKGLGITEGGGCINAGAFSFTKKWSRKTISNICKPEWLNSWNHWNMMSMQFTS